jgi:DNA-binding response OmpR family regulator
MVVDDDANIRAILGYRFEKEHYEVQLASDGLDALRQVEDHQPDVIILDLMMPEMDGIQFLSQLRSKPHTERIPVVILTALGSDAYIDETRELGAAGVVTKPFSPRRLVQEVKGILNGARAVQQGGSR